MDRTGDFIDKKTQIPFVFHHQKYNLAGEFSYEKKESVETISINIQLVTVVVRLNARIQSGRITLDSKLG